MTAHDRLTETHGLRGVTVIRCPECDAGEPCQLVRESGAIARPDMIRFTNGLPKTRSGKIMRRLLRDIAAGKETTQDTTTLEDFNVLAKLRESDEA